MTTLKEIAKRAIPEVVSRLPGGEILAPLFELINSEFPEKMREEVAAYLVGEYNERLVVGRRELGPKGVIERLEKMYDSASLGDKFSSGYATNRGFVAGDRLVVFSDQESEGVDLQDNDTELTARERLIIITIADKWEPFMEERDLGDTNDILRPTPDAKLWRIIISEKTPNKWFLRFARSLKSRSQTGITENMNEPTEFGAWSDVLDLLENQIPNWNTDSQDS